MCERKNLAYMTSKIFGALTFYIPKIINDIQKHYCNNRPKHMTIWAQSSHILQHFTESFTATALLMGKYFDLNHLYVYGLH